MISILLHYLRFILCPKIWSVFINILHALEKTVLYALLLMECSMNIDKLTLVDSAIQIIYILTYFLLILSIIERGVPNSATLIVNLSISSSDLLVCASCILQFCYVHTCLRYLCFLVEVTFYHYIMFLFILK